MDQPITMPPQLTCRFRIQRIPRMRIAHLITYFKTEWTSVHRKVIELRLCLNRDVHLSFGKLSECGGWLHGGDDPSSVVVYELRIGIHQWIAKAVKRHINCGWTLVWTLYRGCRCIWAHSMCAAKPAEPVLPSISHPKLLQQMHLCSDHIKCDRFNKTPFWNFLEDHHNYIYQ